MFSVVINSVTLCVVGDAVDCSVVLDQLVVVNSSVTFSVVDIVVTFWLVSDIVEVGADVGL